MSEISGKSLLKERIDVTEPPKYNVIFHDDDKTEADFVSQLLKLVFFYKENEIEAKLEEIVREGKAIVGVFSREIAETKVEICKNNAKKGGYGMFKVTYEPCN